ncbi:MAG: translation initiation factor IF-2, partial [Thermodesulfobacteriota bacterium]
EVRVRPNLIRRRAASARPAPAAEAASASEQPVRRLEALDELIAPQTAGDAGGGVLLDLPAAPAGEPAATAGEPAPAPAAAAIPPPSGAGEHNASRAAVPPAPAEAGMRRVRVVGKIDLAAVRPAPRPAAGTRAPRGDAAARRGAQPFATHAAAPGAGPQTPLPAAPARPGRRRTIQRDPHALERPLRGARRPAKRRPAPNRVQQQTAITTPSAHKRVVRIGDAITVAELARALGLKAGEVVKKLIELGVPSTANHLLDLDHATLVAVDFGWTVESAAVDVEQEVLALLAGESGAPAPRNPVVTVMGHVDHGKTSLLDRLRSTRVAEGEAGGITQHIGASVVEGAGRRVTFIDTPGHEAFTAMRARGAQVTDLVVLVVAADDGVMPQTLEAIDHARAAGVPIVVAVNKIDLPDADPSRVEKQLADHGLVPEAWGGDTIFVPVSARTGEGLDRLLEMILLQSDVLGTAARPSGRARGAIVEARLDRGRGPVATVLVREGELHPGDTFVCGLTYGRVRALLDDRGRQVAAAGPSTPVEILGLTGVPEAGDALVVTPDEATARRIAEQRRLKQRERELARTAKVWLEELQRRAAAQQAREIEVVLKTDVHGSIDALRAAFERLSTGEVRVRVLHAAVGAITESDVLLAAASNAIVIGFAIRPEAKARKLAATEGVEIRLYAIIYEAIDDMRRALEGMLAPVVRERSLGRAEVRHVFRPTGSGKSGLVAGSLVTEGKVARGDLVRLLRDLAVVQEGRVASLRRFKEDVREVAAGYECGIGLDGITEIRTGDVLEAYKLEEVARRLEDAARPRLAS